MRGGLSPEDRATLQRWAFRAYNACGTGDLEDPKSVFDKLETEKRALKLMGATKSSEKTAIHRRATRHSVTRWMEVSMRSSTERSSPSSIAKADAINMTACSKRTITSCRPRFLLLAHVPSTPGLVRRRRDRANNLSIFVQT